MGTDNKRMARVEREIREIVASYLISDFRSPVPGLLTVSRVWVSKDLRLSRIYVSFLSTDEAKNPLKDVIEALNERAFDFQRKIGKELQMRYTPRLEFFLDETLEQSLHVQDLIRKIETKVADPSLPTDSSDDE